MGMNQMIVLQSGRDTQEAQVINGDVELTHLRRDSVIDVCRTH